MSRATAHLDADELRVAQRIARTGYEPPAWPRPLYTLPAGLDTLPGLQAHCLLTDGLQGCWIWRRLRRGQKQGVLRAVVDGRRTTITARQAAWQLSGKPLPVKGWVLRTTCGRRACCNPAHARIDSKAAVAAENAKHKTPARERAAAKQRLPAAQRLPFTQLRRQGLTYAQIAQRLGVSLNTAWRHSRIDALTGAAVP